MSDELKDSVLSELLLWLLRLRRRFRVTGASMIPVLKPGDEVLVNPRAYRRMPPNPGDIVLVQHPYKIDLKLVKRVTSRLEDGRCYLEGDNRTESTDSRTFGPVAPEKILGQVTSRFP